MDIVDTSHPDQLRQDLVDFTYRVSHDFSAPLRTITEFSRMLRDEHASQLDDEGRLYLNLVVQAGEKMKGMFEGLLTLSRLNTQPGQPEVVDVQQLLDQLSAKYKQFGALTYSGMPQVRMDPQHALTLFRSILDNAFKFVGPGVAVKVQVDAEREGDFWRFRVSDNGIGIAPEFQNDVFIIFRRLHKDTVYPGLGVGLTVAQRIVSLYCGQIGVTSEEQRGSTFSFTLPAA